MRYQAILFDADGLVIRSERKFSETLETEHGIPKEKLHAFFTGVFQDCSIGRADLKNELGKVIEDWGWRGTVDELLEHWFSVGTMYNQETIQLVRELSQSGVRCFLTTNQERYRGEYLRKSIGGGNPFEQVFYSAEFGMKKGDPAFFERVVDRINLASRNVATQLIQPEDILLVDHDEKNLIAGKTVGLQTHHFSTLTGLRTFLFE